METLEVRGFASPHGGQATEALGPLSAPPLQARRCGSSALYLCLGGIIHENADLSLEIDRQIRLMPATLKRFGPELYDDRTTDPLGLRVRMLKVEVI